jgi:hypothetical protein
MKTMLWCKIFGHKFMANVGSEGTYWRVLAPVEFCVRCGLSKKEIEEK